MTVAELMEKLADAHPTDEVYIDDCEFGKLHIESVVIDGGLVVLSPD